MNHLPYLLDKVFFNKMGVDIYMLKRLLTYRNLHIVSVLAILGVFTIAAIAYIQKDVAFINFIGLNHYEIGKCFYREHFGITCPSCGLTRSFISIENFRFRDAFSFNRVGIMIYLLFIFVLVFNVFGICKAKITGYIGKCIAVYAVLICLVLVISWVLNFFFGI